ncbi:hypothetical protein OBBRIDRAFT_796228 [Obba rivulosa]|uniref:F-box domain-containing protein n=1 Tax=Obba rivulosa TaxID=1052685 RepID=A0A8E2DLZ9_9APHY|nr:hypothetical protein OBBRIDRAFT_796228 [Obba rivulosa]
MSAAALPVELWLEIFRWGTLSSLTIRLNATSYHPFETTTLTTDDTLRTKLSLVLVCRQWRRLALEFLYEDIWLREMGSLAEQLLQGREGEGVPGYGRWVRRAYLPYANTITDAPRMPPIVEMLHSCQNLQVLTRPGPYHFPRRDDILRFDFPAGDCPSLTSLKRLDWWHHNEAARSGGINFLPDILRAAPNLQYLSLGGEIWLNFLRVAELALPCLTTLRIRRMNILFIQQICRWSMPNLRHIIIDTFVDVAMLEPFWEEFGEQIQTVELGNNLKYYVSDALASILSGCPRLEELYYYIHFTAKPLSLRDKQICLHTVGLHAQTNSAFHPIDSPLYWDHIQEHFAILSQPYFPKLMTISLYGDWTPVFSHHRYHALVQPLLDRGCTVDVRS